MKRLHIIGGKNHGKTTLLVELLGELGQRGIAVGTIKHTHHHHELDVPGKDSHQHRLAGAAAVGILSPAMAAVFLPGKTNDIDDPYSIFAPFFVRCQFILVEGDSQTRAPKIEVWRRELGTPPLAADDKSILAVASDDPLPMDAVVLRRSDIAGLADWLLNNLPWEVC
jgi:molybdopterin-guanine dinucleotide biosynthesis protein MobB